MKKWQYVSMTAVLGSALLLGACGSDNEEEGTTSANGTEQETKVLLN